MNITFISSTFPIASPQQQNAIYSWKEAGIPFILAGDTDTTGAKLVLKGIKTEEALGFSGNSPLINDMVKKACLFTRTDMLALINSDIIIEPDFLPRLDKIISKYGKEIFLTSVRRDSKFDARINSKEDLLRVFQAPWDRHQDASADLFLTSVDLFKKFAEDTADFIYGRLAWDNWIHIYFHAKGIPCYNTSNQLILWHQKHGYDHIQIESFSKLNQNPSVNHNLHTLGNSVLKIGKTLGDIIRVNATFPEPVV